MKEPQFFIGTETIRGQRSTLEPTSFVDAGCSARQIEAIRKFVQLCYREFAGISDIPPSMADRFPDRIPLYLEDPAVAGEKITATASYHSALPPKPVHAESIPRYPFTQLTGLTLTARPSTIENAQESFRLKCALAFTFTTIATNRSITMVMDSRDGALNSGIANKLYLQPDDTSGFSIAFLSKMETHDATTCGLSPPDGCMVNRSFMSQIISPYALAHIPNTRLWAFAELLSARAEEAGGYLFSAEIDEIVRQFFVEEAERILMHPAFLQVASGPQMIVSLSRDKTKLLFNSFTAKELPPRDEETDSDFWHPVRIQLEDRPVHWRMSLQDTKGNMIHPPAPVSFSNARRVGMSKSAPQAMALIDLSDHEKEMRRERPKWFQRYATTTITGGGTTVTVPRLKKK